MDRHQNLTLQNAWLTLKYAVKEVWKSCVLISVLTVIYYFFNEHSTENRKLLLFAEQEKIYNQSMQIPCSLNYIRETTDFLECKPNHCGRYVLDNVFSNQDIQKMLQIFKKALKYGGSVGSSSVFDFGTGALSKGVHFVNLYKHYKIENLYKREEIEIYKKIRKIIHKIVANSFEISEKNLYFAHPSFFTRLNNRPAVSVHDEYWKKHVDKEQYSAHFYTTILFLNNFGLDYSGGQFEFDETDETRVIIEPRRDRILLFTSGHENVHHVEKIMEGEQYSITIAFTCDPAQASYYPLFDQ